uniref:Single domain-containing protein n=1 Tax=Amblyomma maculatum TaxID=34609 RepID=G3MR14_AMBMU
MCSKLSLAVYAIVAVTGTLWHISEAYSGQVHVEVLNGTCIYANRTLGHRRSIQLKEPCEGWYCDANRRIIFVGWCSPVALLGHCRTVKGNGTYPNCCPRMVCN